MKNSFINIIKEYEKDPKEMEEAISTGFNNLDELITGIQPKDLIVVAARPNIGKTKLLINLTFNIANQIPVSFISFEDESYNINKRFIAAKNAFVLKSSERTLKNISLFTSKDFNFDIAFFFESLKKQIRENKISVFVIDGLQFMIPRKTYSFFEFYDDDTLDYDTEIKCIVRSLAQFAKTNNVSIITSTNLNRSIDEMGGDRKPRVLSHLGDKEIELEATKIIFMYDASYYGITEDEDGDSTIGKVELIIKRNKNMKLGSIFLREIPENYEVYYENDFINIDKEIQNSDFGDLE